MNSHHQQSFVEQLKQLQSVAQNKYGIDIATEKFVKDDSYRNLVLSELKLLGDPELDRIIAAIQQPVPTESTQEPANPEQKKIPLALILAGSAAVIAIALAGYVMLGGQANTPAQPIASVAALPPSVQQQITPVEAKNTEVETAQLSFRIHGSNTIGERLAPALLEGYLTDLGADQFEWRQGDVTVERELHYQLGDKPYFIELHAHGSSTGFSDILEGEADLAMASRKVKGKEVNALKSHYGDFSQVGNEHIIGLDGLAVIVNQNNQISHLTTKQLADVFAGKITNWQELGGRSAAINLYARDAKSGTWDTFKNLVLKPHGAALSEVAKRFESSSELSQLVSQDEFSIGFIGLNYILHNKAIAVSEGQLSAPIYPTRFTIGTEDYALSRRLYLYTPTTADMFIKNFAHYAISFAGQEIVADTGLISQNIHVEQVVAPRSAPAMYKEYAAQGERLSLTFRFQFGSGKLDNKGQRDLQRLLGYLEEFPEKRVVLMGFSDNSGDANKNLSLSSQRARSVATELSARGVSVFDTQGFGDALPVANNDSEQGRERNRRVEVWVL